MSVAALTVSAVAGQYGPAVEALQPLVVPQLVAVTVVVEAVAITEDYIVVLAVGQAFVGSAAGALTAFLLVAETVGVAQIAVATLFDLSEATSAPQLVVVEVVFVAELVAVVVTAGEIAAVLAPAAVEFVLGTLAAAVVVLGVVAPAEFVVPLVLVPASLSVVDVGLVEPAAVMLGVTVPVVVMELVWPSAPVSVAAPGQHG